MDMHRWIWVAVVVLVGCGGVPYAAVDLDAGDAGAEDAGVPLVCFDRDCVLRVLR